jgi:hypothetical protein
MRGLGQHLDDHVGAGLGSPGMGWKNRLADLEFLRHGTPRLENLTGTRARTEPMMADAYWSPQGLRAAQMLGHHVAATFPLFLTHVNSFAKIRTSRCTPIHETKVSADSVQT